MRIAFIDYNPCQAGHRLRIGVNLDLKCPGFTARMLRPDTHWLLDLVIRFGNDRLLGQALRFLEVLGIFRSSVVICSKPLTKRAVYLLEIAKLFGRGVVVDICDNHFHNPYASDSIVSALDRGIQQATLVTVPSVTLGAQLLATKRVPVIIVEDDIDEACIPAPSAPSLCTASRTPQDLRAKLLSEGLLWFGFAGWNDLCGGKSSSSLAQLVPAIRDLAKYLDVECDQIVLRTVSNEPSLVSDYIGDLLDQITLSCQEWSISSMQEALRHQPLVLLTYGDSKIDLGKSANRVELALAAGCPVVVNRFLSGWCSELRPMITVLGDGDHAARGAFPMQSIDDFIEAKRSRVIRAWRDIVVRARRGVQPSWIKLIKRVMMYVVYG
jgi:hypothetical protein